MEQDDAPPKYPSQPPPPMDAVIPHVMISGAGLAGMLLGILLEEAGVPYHIFERAKAVKPLGAVMALNVNILPALEQIGLLEDLQRVAMPGGPFKVYTGELKQLACLLSENEAIGYQAQVFARSHFYDLLLSKIPPEKLHLGKKVLSIEQNKEGVMIRCSDGTTFHGDILVGADGAHSGVRQSLYKHLKDEKRLPPNDKKDFSRGYICMVGTTVPLDPEEYPALKLKHADLNQIIGDGNKYCWSAFTVANNCICWNVIFQLKSVKESKDLKFMNSEWGPEVNEPMIQEVKDFKTPFGTLGSLIDKTPRELISRVFLEDKLFETWNDNRTVLIGDAAHKLLPASGQGAVQALQDAVILANCIYECPGREHKDIVACLQAFKDDRFPHVKHQYESSKINAKLIYGQTWFERGLRHVIFNYIPDSVAHKNLYKSAEYQPMVSFLPLPPKRGTIPVLAQKPSKKYAAEQAKMAAEAALAIETAQAV